MSKDISSMEEGFQDLQAYSDAQFKTIIELKSRIATLESENNSLKTMLEQNLPSIGLKADDIIPGISNEQLICETQLHFLKTLAVVRDLTMEETRKFQIFSDVLQSIKAKAPGETEITLKKMSPAELLSIVKANE
jgi:hypothetical protein